MKNMLKGVLADKYTGGPMRVAFQDTNTLDELGGYVNAEIRDKEGDYAELDKLRSALKSRFWGPSDAHRDIPTPHLPLLAVDLREGYHGAQTGVRIDSALMAVQAESKNTAKRYDGVLPDMTLTKVLAISYGDPLLEIPIAKKA